MILIFPPYWLRQFSAFNWDESTPKIVNVTENKPPEPQPTASRYQGIKISREELISYLEVTFTQYGLEDQIETAKKVLNCEGGFQVDPLPHNGISWGVAQFTPETWKDFGYGDIMNPQTQIQTMAKMVEAGLWVRWDCYRMIK